MRNSRTFVSKSATFGRSKGRGKVFKLDHKPQGYFRGDFWLYSFDSIVAFHSMSVDVGICENAGI